MSVFNFKACLPFDDQARPTGQCRAALVRPSRDRKNSKRGQLEILVTSFDLEASLDKVLPDNLRSSNAESIDHEMQGANIVILRLGPVMAKPFEITFIPGVHDEMVWINFFKCSDPNSPLCHG